MILYLHIQYHHEAPCYFKYSLATSLVARMVKCLPTMRETQVRSLGWEDPLEKETTAHSSTLAWEIPWMEEHGRLQSMTEQLLFLSCHRNLTS